MQNILKKISRFGLKLLVPLTAQESYTLIVSEGCKLIQGEYGSIMLREGSEFKRVYTNSPISYHSRVRQRAYSYRAYVQRRIFVVPASKTVKAHPELKVLGIKYSVHIPLSYKNQSIGVLIINSKNDAPSKSDLENLKLFGSMASLAIRKTQLYDETKAALEARDHFISMASHELRTPLTSVSGYIQLLRSKLAKNGGSEGRWIEQLYQESQRMENLVKELLEINRIKEGKLNYFLRLCSLREVLENVKKIMGFSFPDKEIIIENKLNNLPDKVIADQDKLLQIFTNLVENAIKYSSENTPVWIVLSSKNNDFVVYIKDEGIGIPKKELKKIFEGYQQGSGHNKEGMGLGLFLVKNILTKLYGSIKVRSKVDKGTTMEVRLPKAKI